jgi:hypothetical protein
MVVGLEFVYPEECSLLTISTCSERRVYEFIPPIHPEISGTA